MEEPFTNQILHGREEKRKHLLVKNWERELRLPFNIFLLSFSKAVIVPAQLSRSLGKLKKGRLIEIHCYAL